MSSKNNNNNNKSVQRILHHTKILESKELQDSDDDSNTIRHGFHTSNDNEKSS